MTQIARPLWFTAAGRTLRPFGWQGAVGALCLLVSALIVALPWRATDIETSLSRKALQLRTERLTHEGMPTGPTARRAADSPGRVEERGRIHPPEAVYDFLRSVAEAGFSVHEARYDWSEPSNTQFGLLEVRFSLRSDYSRLRQLMETLLSRDQDIALRRVAIRVAEPAGVPSAPPSGAQRPERAALEAELHWLIFFRSPHGDVSSLAESTEPKR